MCGKNGYCIGACAQESGTEERGERERACKERGGLYGRNRELGVREKQAEREH